MSEERDRERGEGEDRRRDKVVFKESDFMANSLSQIDPNFINELPIDLRQEIVSTIESNDRRSELNSNYRNKRIVLLLRSLFE